MGSPGSRAPFLLRSAPSRPMSASLAALQRSFRERSRKFTSITRGRQTPTRRRRSRAGRRMPRPMGWCAAMKRQRRELPWSAARRAFGIGTSLPRADVRGDRARDAVPGAPGAKDCRRRGRQEPGGAAGGLAGPGEGAAGRGAPRVRGLEPQREGEGPRARTGGVLPPRCQRAPRPTEQPARRSHVRPQALG
jgi:hypothetical protein